MHNASIDVHIVLLNLVNVKKCNNNNIDNKGQ